MGVLIFLASFTLLSKEIYTRILCKLVRFIDTKDDLSNSEQHASLGRSIRSMGIK
jgi:hypothetical protein